MVVKMRRSAVWCALRLVDSTLTEIEGHKVLRSKDWGDRKTGIAALEKVVARRVKGGWREEARTDDDFYGRVLDDLAKKQESWRGLGDGTKALIQSSGHVPASANVIDEVTGPSGLPSAYRDFLLSTNGFWIRCRFEKNGYQNEAVATFLSLNGVGWLGRDLRSAYPNAIGAREILVEVDVMDPHLNHLDQFSGAVLDLDAGSVAVWTDGERARAYPDFRAYFKDWLSHFNDHVQDTWGDVARR